MSTFKVENVQQKDLMKCAAREAHVYLDQAYRKPVPVVGVGLCGESDLVSIATVLILGLCRCRRPETIRACFWW